MHYDVGHQLPWESDDTALVSNLIVEPCETGDSKLKPCKFPKILQIELFNSATFATAQDWDDLFGHVAPPVAAEHAEPQASSAVVNVPPLTAGSAVPAVESTSVAAPTSEEDAARWFSEADTDGDGRCAQSMSLNNLQPATRTSPPL